MPTIRNSAKAIIIHADRLLAVKYRDADGVWYSLPGGGQRHGESLAETVKRECQEELGIQVSVGILRYVREYIGANHEFAVNDSPKHQVDFMFECQFSGNPLMNAGEDPDDGQLGVEWLPLSDLEDFRLYPSILRTMLAEPSEIDRSVYLGDVN